MDSILDAPVHPLAEVFPPLAATDYDALKASIDDVGLQYPVLVTADGQLLDGVHRRRACQELGVHCDWEEISPNTDPLAIVIAANKARRHLNESQRALVAAKIANLPEGRNWSITTPRGVVSQSSAADMMNVGQRSVSRAAKVKDQPVLAKAVEEGVLDVNNAHSIAGEPEAVQRKVVERVVSGADKTPRKAVASVRRNRAREKAVEESADAPAPPGLFVSDIVDLAAHVGAGTVDAIITDPPYLKENVADGIYRKLGAFARRALKPGGLLLAIVPHHYIEQVLGQVREAGMDYRWLMAYTQPQAKQRVHGFKVSCMWKPWAAWTQPGGHPGFYSNDWIASGLFDAAMKNEHPWGQKTGGLKNVLQEWVQNANSVVCDPFCGAGSHLVAAAALGHRVIGADIDAANVALARKALGL